MLNRRLVRWPQLFLMLCLFTACGEDAAEEGPDGVMDVTADMGANDVVDMSDRDEGGNDTSTMDTLQRPDMPLLTCEAPEVNCGNGVCANLVSDKNHCGACNAPCGGSMACRSGVCEQICPDVQLACDEVCVSPSSSPTDCGACGVMCAADEVCAQGSCGVSCGALTQCGRACADTNIDPAHCGGCDQRCDVDNATASCISGICVPAVCFRGWADCDQEPDNGCEANIASDSSRCGACDVVCNDQEFCSEGDCVPSCPLGERLCSGVCEDIRNDPLHCGGCDSPCGPGGTCINGFCDDPPPGPVSSTVFRSRSRSIEISWVLPEDTDLSSVVIRRSTAGPPQTTLQGELVCDGCNSPYLDTSLEERTTYHYTIWAIDAVGGLSTPSLGEATTPNAWTFFPAIYVKASNTDPLDEFGSAVALSANGLTMAVGAVSESGRANGVNGNEQDDSGFNVGAVYVYDRVSRSEPWSQVAYIKASNPGSGDTFGRRLTLSADGLRLAVGSPNEDGSERVVNGADNNSASNAGAAYIYERATTSEQWSQVAYLKPTNLDAGDTFGRGLVMNAAGDLLVVGAQYEESAGAFTPSDNTVSDAGAAYVFTRDGFGAWSQVDYIKPPNAGIDDRFGYDIAVSANGNTIVIGAPEEDSAATSINGDTSNNTATAAGAAYVFERNPVLDFWGVLCLLEGIECAGRRSLWPLGGCVCRWHRRCRRRAP